ncbi:MAG: hypothetical protein ABI537_05850 [Casimicrobiaceae bacterium]
MDSEISALEHKVAALLAEYHRLRADNESLRRELGRAHEQGRVLAARVQAASTRLDSLLQQLPEPASQP